MTFLGFYVLENPLREGAESVLRLLDQKFISCKIITGDNLFTALNVGKKVGIVPRESPVYLAENVTKGDKTECCWLQMSKFFTDVDVDEDDFNNYINLTNIRLSFLEEINKEIELKGELNKNNKKKSKSDDHDDENSSEDHSDSEHSIDSDDSDEHSGHGHGHGHDDKHTEKSKIKEIKSNNFE